MNCSNCNTPLNDGENICPKCGALNLGFNQELGASNASSKTPAVFSEEAENFVDNNKVSEVVIPDDKEMEQDVTHEMPDIELEDDPEKIEELNIGEDTINYADENTLPPDLLVNNENMTEGVEDISTANVSTYETEPTEVKEEVKEEEKKLDFDLAIPEVSEPIEKVDTPLDGSAPDVVANKTVGSETKKEDLEESIEVKHKKRIKLPTFKTPPKPIQILGYVVLFIIGILIGAVAFSKNVCSTAPVRNTNVSKNVVADGKNNVTKAGVFKYNIPRDYIYDKKDNGVIVYDDKSTWRIYFRALPGLYDDLASAKTSVRATMVSSGLIVENIKETKINKNLYLIVEGMTKTTTRLTAFKDAGHDHVFYIEIVTLDNTLNYDLLKVADDILSNAEYDEEIAKIEGITVKDTADLAVLAAQEYKSRLKK